MTVAAEEQANPKYLKVEKSGGGEKKKEVGNQ